MILSPFHYGSKSLPSNLFCAPLAGCSDLPFRQMTCRYRPGLVFCEMVKVDALIRHDPQTYRLLDYTKEMHPIGAQICGSKPNDARVAARIIEDLGFDVLDLNCGCPVDKVTKDGSGSGLLKNPERIGEIIALMVDAVDMPVSVKIRVGWDDQTINAAEITKIAEEAGAVGLTIHGRTREQGYKGKANWEIISECRRVARTMKIIGNGDIFDAATALEKFSLSGCDGILLARGTLGQPWIIEDVERALKGLPPLVRGIDVIRETLWEHFEAIVSYQNDVQSLLDMRRVGCWYLKSCKGAKPLRMQINQATSVSSVFSLLKAFDWQQLEEPAFCAALGAGG